MHTERKKITAVESKERTSDTNRKKCHSREQQQEQQQQERILDRRSNRKHEREEVSFLFLAIAKDLVRDGSLLASLQQHHTSSQSDIHD